MKGQIPHDIFVSEYMRVYRAGGTYVDLAAAFALGVEQTIRRTRWHRHARRVALPPLRRRSTGLVTGRAAVLTAERALLLDVMRDQLSSYVAKPPRQIFADTIAEYGEVGERRLWRALAALRARRLAIATVAKAVGVDSADVRYRRAA